MSYQQPPPGQQQQYQPPPGPPGAPGAPSYGAPPQPYGQQPAYGAPPQGYAPPGGAPQYPPPGGAQGYPQQQYAPPGGHSGGAPQYGAPAQPYGQPAYPQQGYAPPPAGAQPPPQQYGAPPAQQAYGAPPTSYPAQQAYPQPPAAGYPAPPSSGYNPAYAAPQQGYPAPPQGYAQPPAGYPAYQPQQGYYPPQGQQAYAPPPPAIPKTYLGTLLHPSENVLLPAQERTKENVTVDGYDPAKDVETIKKATKGMGTNESLITGVLASLTAVRIPPLVYAYKARHGTPLYDLLKKELGGKYEELALAVIRGPLGGDVELVQRACLGTGTDETLLNELLIGRNPSSLDLLRASYLSQTRTSLDSIVLSELSLKTKKAFTFALLGEWKDQVDGGKGAGAGVGGFGGAGEGVLNAQMVEADLQILVKAIKITLYAEPEADETLLSSVILARSPLHLHHLQIAYLRAKKAPLTRHVKLAISGHLKSALLFALEGGKKDTTGCWRDAKMIEKTMAGAGTDDSLLIIRIVRAHWDTQRFRAVQTAYKAKYGKALSGAVMKETSGDFRDALLAIIEGGR